MKSVRVRRGEAPLTSDRIYIDRVQDSYAWNGVVDVGGSAVFGAGPAEFKTPDEAEADALAWARGHGSAEILIEIRDAQGI